MKGDETCQSNIQRTWGVERQQYPDIMFEYLPHDVPSVANPGLCMFYGMVVIDFVSAHVPISISCPARVSMHISRVLCCLNTSYTPAITVTSRLAD